MSWEDQGRQHRGWFGHGTAVGRGTRNASFPCSLDDRIHAVAYGAIAALPAPVRGRVEGQYQHGALSDLREAMTTWTKETHLDQATFAGGFLGRAANDPVALSLRSAVNGAARATSPDDIKDAASHLADAIKGVSVDQWPRFVANAAARGRITENGFGQMTSPAQAHGSQSGPTKVPLQKAQLVIPLPSPPPTAGVRSDHPSRAAARYLTQGWKAVTEAARNVVGSIVNAEIENQDGQVSPHPDNPFPSAHDKLPHSFGQGQPNQTGDGWRWVDKSGNGVRIDKGDPTSANPAQQQDHVRVQSGGRTIDHDGNPIPQGAGKTGNRPEAHIPYSDWTRWGSWDHP